MSETHDTQLGEPIGEPIVVPQSASQQIVWTLVRYALVALAGSSFVKGIFGEDFIGLLTSDTTVALVAGGIITLGLSGWGALKSKKNVRVQQALAHRLPDNVARTG